MKLKFLISVLLLTFTSNNALAFKNTTAEEILQSNTSPEEIGKAIMVEFDKRDFGFGDMEVDLKMILRNQHGQEITRTQRNKTFEVEDPNKGDKTLIIFDNPRDVKGTAFLTFSNILTPDDQWLYLPSLKRVKRISSKNKSGSFVGSEFAYEDISSQEVEKFSYKYIRNEPCG
ncbi:MAG: outer membrane lipoprotein-sorting protein, partial [Rickettsiales bacterium]|nr:outer membrane lipoprotein-sorting protein [Rickettsiales bacterium]